MVSFYAVKIISSCIVHTHTHTHAHTRRSGRLNPTNNSQRREGTTGASTHRDDAGRSCRIIGYGAGTCLLPLGGSEGQQRCIAEAAVDAGVYAHVVVTRKTRFCGEERERSVQVPEVV